jgi:hypothetical protein
LEFALAVISGAGAAADWAGAVAWGVAEGTITGTGVAVAVGGASVGTGVGVGGTGLAAAACVAS